MTFVTLAAFAALPVVTAVSRAAAQTSPGAPGAFSVSGSAPQCAGVAAGLAIALIAAILASVKKTLPSFFKLAAAVFLLARLAEGIFLTYRTVPSGFAVTLAFSAAILASAALLLYTGLAPKDGGRKTGALNLAASAILVLTALLDLILTLLKVRTTGIAVVPGYALWAVLEIVSAVRKPGREIFKLAGDNAGLDEKLDGAENELASLRKELEETVYFDPVTGLFNRRELYRKMKFEKERLKRYHRTSEVLFSVVYIELENLDYYRTAYGETAVPLILSGFADIVRHFSRASDVPCCLENGQFVTMLIETDEKGAGIFAERLIKEIAERDWFGGELCRLTGVPVRVPAQQRIGCSAGIANYVIDTTSEVSDLDLDAAIEKAERAMQSAKAEGKNRTAVWESILK